MHVKLSRVTKQIEEDKKKGDYSEEKERALFQKMTEDMKPLMIDTLW